MNLNTNTTILEYMTQEEPFLMVSLKDDKTKKLANALSNKSANKILNYLANKKSATEKEMAKELQLPVSTVNYTIKVLQEAKLVTAKEYHYSEKGREVNHYSLARKYIIIAPQEESTTSVFDKLKTLLPAGLLALGATTIIQALTSVEQAAPMAMRAEVMMADAVAETVTEPWYQPLLTTDWAGPALITIFFFASFVLLIDYTRKQYQKKTS